MDSSLSGGLLSRNLQAYQASPAGGQFSGLVMPPAVPPSVSSCNSNGNNGSNSLNSLPPTQNFANALAAWQLGSVPTAGVASSGSADTLSIPPANDSWMAATTLGFAGW